MYKNKSQYHSYQVSYSEDITAASTQLPGLWTVVSTSLDGVVLSITQGIKSLHVGLR